MSPNRTWPVLLTTAVVAAASLGLPASAAAEPRLGPPLPAAAEPRLGPPLLAAARPGPPLPAAARPRPGPPLPAAGTGNCASTNGSWYRADRGSDAAAPTSTDRAADTVAVHDEIGAQACYTRAGDRATITYSWGAVGRAETGSLTFELYDCTAKLVEPAMSHTLNLPEPDPTRGGKGRETFTVRAGHRYQPRVSGEGAYDRTGSGAGGPDTGYFSRTGSPPFSGEGTCQ